jgi:hypothetical protein
VTEFFFFSWFVCHAVGYKSRADENSWNGASRKVLDNELATHLAMYQSIPDIYSSVRFASLPTSF